MQARPNPAESLEIDRYDPGMRVLPGVLTGAVFGAATSLVNNVPGMLGEVGQAHSEDSVATWAAIFVSLIIDSGWAWAALGFVLGYYSGFDRRPLRAALVGAGGLILATVAYYSTDLLFGIETDRPTVSFWLARAVVFGLVLGCAGALARLARDDRPAGHARRSVRGGDEHGAPSGAERVAG